MVIQEIKQRLAEEVERLNHELAVTLPETLARALAMGDLRENADYQAAIERQQFIHARLSHLRARLARLADVDLARIPTDRVGLGSRVEVEDASTGSRETYEMVVPDAMDPDAGHVSVASPLGRALLDRRAGDAVEVRLPGGVRQLLVVKLETVHQLGPGEPS